MAVLEWEEVDDRVVVRRSGLFSSTQVQEALFPDGVPERRSLEELKEGIRKHLRKRYAGG
ncbi:MAG: hypothetical protein KF911_01790 [Pseudomonadales bacterium]|nr:hypothetical protein [Pseudomonadales bacterium]